MFTVLRKPFGSCHHTDFTVWRVSLASSFGILWEFFLKPVFGWKPVLWLLQRHCDKPAHIDSRFHLDSCEQILQWISSSFFFFFHFSIPSYLLLLCLHLPLYLPSSLSSPPLLKRLSSGMRWRSYRPLAAHLLNCQQLRVKRDLTETLSHNVCIAAEELTGRVIKARRLIFLGGHHRPHEMRHKLLMLECSPNTSVAVTTALLLWSRSITYLLTTTGIGAVFYSSCCRCSSWGNRIILMVQ